MSLEDAEKKLKDWMRTGGFAVALSGGGHRATLATLGCLMAIIDRNLGSQIMQVASVSGGSITNAFVAWRSRDLRALRHGELDDIASQLATTIIRRGVLTPSWIIALIVFPMFLGIAMAAVSKRLVGDWTWVSLLIGISAAIAGFAARGLVIEWLLDRRYFRFDYSKFGIPISRQRALFSELSVGQIDHVFCMTDLVLGLPLYASSLHGGMIWRRLQHQRDRQHFRLFQTFKADDLPISAIVRASAAFPGIPPRRLRVPVDPQIPEVAELPEVAFLGDGGLWNNLGTQVLREDEFLGSYAGLDEKGVLRPYYNSSPLGVPLLCFNASAGILPTNSWAFKIPVFALLKNLWQVPSILSANTVVPRVEIMEEAYYEQLHAGFRPVSPNIIVDLRPTDHLMDRYQEWSRSELSRKQLKLHPAYSKCYGFDESEPSLLCCGVARYEDHQTLRGCGAWAELMEKFGVGPVSARTHLRRIDHDLAKRIIGRAYINTYLATIFLKPFAEDEMSKLSEVARRLDRVVEPEREEL